MRRTPFALSICLPFHAQLECKATACCPCGRAVSLVPSQEVGMKPCAPDDSLQNALCLLGSPLCCVVSRINIQMCSLGHDIGLALAPKLASALLRLIFLEYQEGPGGRLWQSYRCTDGTSVPCQSFQPSFFALGWCTQYASAQVEDT